MSYAEICGAVENIKKKYDETDPFRLCKAMGIKLLFESLGTAPDAVKGFFLVCKRIRTITINSDLPVPVQRIVASHEIGHAVLHRNRGVHAFHEVSMFDVSSTLEQEASIFAAEYLLDDKDVLEMLNTDNTFFTAASRLLVPSELLDFKFRVMKWKGYKLMEPPVTSPNNWMKNMDIPTEEIYT